MTTLAELANWALAEGRAEVFFKLLERSYVYHVCPSGLGNPDVFLAVNTSTSDFEWISGNSLVEETEAPTGMGYGGFDDLDPTPFALSTERR